jgi:hypothetical protein
VSYKPWLLSVPDVPDVNTFAQLCYALASRLRDAPGPPSAADLLEVMGEHAATHLAQVHKNTGNPTDLAAVDWTVFADIIRAGGGILTED